MTSARDLPPAIQWHEGMLLAPQHFQQDQLRQEVLLNYHSSALSPFYWGVRHLRIDPVLLVDGVLRILELEAVLPDGLVISRIDDESADLTVDLTELGAELKREPQKVHLAVAARRVAAVLRGEMARYDSIEGDVVVDQNTGEGELRIPRLRPRIRLLATNDPPAKYASMPLLELGYLNESFALTDYVPPLLRVRSSGVSARLHDQCTALARRTREKAVFLSEQASSPAMAGRAPQLLETRALVQGMVATLPLFEAMLAAEASHPFSLYLTLTTLVGHLSALAPGLVPPVLQPYQHNDLYRSYREVLDFSSQVLEQGVSEAFVGFPFRLEDDGSFVIRFEEEWLSRTLVLGVRGREGQSEAEVQQWIDQSLICSTPKITDLRERRIPGAPRQRISGDGDLLPARGVTLFRLTPDPQFVLGNQPLEVRNLDDPGGRYRPVEIVLYVKQA